MGEFCLHSVVNNGFCDDCGEEFYSPSSLFAKEGKGTSDTPKKHRARSDNKMQSGLTKIENLNFNKGINAEVIRIYQLLFPIIKLVPTDIRTYYAIFTAHKINGFALPPHTIAKMLGMKPKIPSKHLRLCNYIYITTRSNNTSASTPTFCEESAIQYFPYYITSLFPHKSPIEIKEIITNIELTYNQAKAFAGTQRNTLTYKKPQDIAAAIIYLWSRNMNIKIESNFYTLVNMTSSVLTSLERNLRKGAIPIF